MVKKVDTEAATKNAAKPASVVFGEECREGLHAAQKQLPLILAVSGARSEENLLVPYNMMLTHIEHSMALASLMSAVHPDKEIREAAKACEQETSAFVTELSLNPELYAAFTAIETKSLDANTQRLVSDTLQDYRRAGVDKDKATRDRLKAIDEEMVKLGQVFGKNIVDDVKHIEVASVDGLKGLPADYIASHAPNKEGKIIITTNYPDMIPFMQYAESDDLRKKLYIAGKSRAGATNEDTLAAILKLRGEKATILGYANWADYVTEDKMMKSGKKADAFIARVVKTAKKRATRDYNELLSWKRKNLNKKAKSVGDWEKGYIENKVKAANYSFDPQEVRPYFPYAQVQAGLLDITSKIYGIEYKSVSDAKLWHQDVSAYDVMRDGSKIGRIYLDMHPRDGKYGHAAQFTLRSGVQGVQVPEGVLVCNFPNPRTSEGPALMEHGDVTTMFHEFGHLMHHVLGGQQKWIEQSGVATEWDFVEAPSQMFEEWAWNYDTLKTFAKHHETGAVLPKETVERMRKADKFGLGIATVQQMFYAAISLKFHQVDPGSLKMLDTVKALQSKYTPFAYVEGTNFHTNFGHLNGYSAIYYTYMWSLVIAKDMLTPFQKHGLMNTDWTYKYRDIILASGGTKDAADLVAEFLGRPFNFKAFEKFLRN
ncbi:MAG: Zn-dependent oligopeptidase [Kofleriaceae bacterium]|nr:Zn-dependent oligopeptidase [Kofleriaceae bacterium]